MSFYSFFIVLLSMTFASPKSALPSFTLDCMKDKPSILCLPDNYSKFDLPFRSQNLIKIGFEISDVLKIDDKDYAITFSLYFSVEWFEPRLNLSAEVWGADQPDLIPVNLELIHSLWVPNIFIYNLKTFQVIDVLSKLAGLWVDKNKRIYYSQATHITFICPMLFDSFPLDTQSCKFQVGSYSYDLARMVFDVSTLGYIQRNQSIVMDYKININNLLEKDKVFDAGALGNFSLAGFEMTLERHMLSYIITYYLPSGLFVVVSWISFLIPPDIVPGRMALLITIFLVLINIFNNITTNSPKAEGLTAIEIWMLACILFVFGALVEYAVILYRKQKAHHYMSPSYSPSYQDTYSFTSYNSITENGDDYREEKYGKNIHTCKDQTSTNPEHGRGQGAPLTTIYMDNTNHSKIPEIRQRNGKTKPKDSLKRENSKTSVVRQHSTWHDRYARVDRFFLFFCPFLFMVFNLLYWGHYQVRCTWCQAD